MAWFSPRLIFTRIYSETWDQKVEWNCSLPLTEASGKLGPRQEIAKQTTTINKKTNTLSWDQGEHAWREPQQWPDSSRIPPTGTNCKSFYKISPVKIGVLFQGDLLARMSLEKCSPGTPFTEFSLPDPQTWLLQPWSKWLLLQQTACLASPMECCCVSVVLFLLRAQELQEPWRLKGKTSKESKAKACPWQVKACS